MNVSGGDKFIGGAALSASFINGIKAFAIEPSGIPLLMPVIKLSFSEILSEPKLNILRAIHSIGGIVESLDYLGQLSGYGKALLSYHIMGPKEAKGLADLGLLEVDKGQRGRISAKLTTVGKLLVTGSAIGAVAPVSH